MSRMRWSWQELQETPVYVRRYCLDILGMIAEHEKQEARRAERKGNRA